MTHTSDHTSQIAGDHVFYDIDWGPWLSERGLASSDILSVATTVKNCELTSYSRSGAVVRVYIKGIRKRVRADVTCTITVTPPQGSEDIEVTFIFYIIGE
jgi:hypothetical protein